MHVRDWAVSIIEKLHKLARVHPHIHIDREIFRCPGKFLSNLPRVVLPGHCNTGMYDKEIFFVTCHMLYTTLCIKYVLTAYCLLYTVSIA